MKYHIAFIIVSCLNLLAPMLTGPLLQMNETKMSTWGWLPANIDIEVGLKANTNTNELHFIEITDK